MAYSVTAPCPPAGTIAAVALIRPSRQFSVETNGWDWPAGQTERKLSPPRGTTVRLSEYAKALAGMPQELDGMLKSRLTAAPRIGPPKGPVGSRVSAMRQGVIGTKRREIGRA